MDSEKLETQLTALAREHKLTVIEEIGFTGPMYRLVSQKDAPAYMELVYGYKTEVYH